MIVSRKKITEASLSDAQSSVALANQALADAISKLADAQQTQQKHRSTAETDLQKAQDEAAVAAAKAQRASAQASVDSTTQALANLKAGIGKYTMTYAVTPLAIVPDGQRRFVANLAHHGYREDSLKLSVVNGLLTTTNSQSTDQTANIIMSLANAAIGITTFVGAGIPVTPLPGPAAAAPAPAPTVCEYAFAATFDPANGQQVTAINTKFTTLGGGTPEIQLDSSFLSEVVKAHLQGLTGLPAGDSAALPSGEAVDGLVYRTAVATQVSILPQAGLTTRPSCPLQAAPDPQSIQMVVPDSNAEYIVPAQAGGMTTSALQLSFSNGMLTDYNVQRPSEVAATASIPVDIVNKIMTIPTSILKLRFDYSTAQTNLANQQAQLITAQSQEALALVNAQTSLQTAETNLSLANLNDPLAKYKALTAIVQAKQALADALAAAKAGTSAVQRPPNP